MVSHSDFFFTDPDMLDFPDVQAYLESLKPEEYAASPASSNHCLLAETARFKHKFNGPGQKILVSPLNDEVFLGGAALAIRVSAPLITVQGVNASKTLSVTYRLKILADNFDRLTLPLGPQMLTRQEVESRFSELRRKEVNNES
jgi:hypothetical protein